MTAPAIAPLAQTDHHRQVAHALYMRLQEAAGQPPQVAMHCLLQVTEQLFRYLTRQEARSFGNLFARMQFCFDRFTTPQSLREQLNTLRFLAGKAAAGEWKPGLAQALTGVQAVAQGIAHFFDVPVPESLQNVLAPVAGNTLGRPAATPVNSVPLLKCMVRAVGPLEALENGMLQYRLECRNAELGNFSLQLQGPAQGLVASLHSLLRPYDTIHALHCVKTEVNGTPTPDGGGNAAPGGNAAGQQIFQSTSATQLVLEPDLLIDISELAECFGRHGASKYLYLIKKLVPQQPGEAAFRGNLVNTLLDTVLRQPGMDMRESFMEAVADNALQAAAYGREVLNAMFSEIRSGHWPNLRQAAAGLEGLPVRIEPTFFSALYGLQGRLDILAEDPADPLRKEIFELKSGRPPEYGAWKNHEMQVTGYNLLLKSAFGPQRRGSSAILYSAAADTPLRNVSTSARTENELLALRNEVVAALLRLAAGEHDILDQINESAAEGLPPFSARHFSTFRQAYSTAPPLYKTYYQQFLSFLLRELLLAKCGMYASATREEDAEGFAALWLQPESEKLARFNIIPGLRFNRFDTGTSTVVFDMCHPVSHNFRAGDTAILYPRSPEGLRPLQHQLLKGRIDGLWKNMLAVSLNNRQITHDFFAQHSEWIIEHDIYESNYWLAVTALFHVLEPHCAGRMALLLGQRRPGSRPLPVACAPMFNTNQQQILQAALEAQDYYLVQGPPGTGKTSSLLTALIAELVERGGQVVVVAFTNRAVDEICKKLDDRQLGYLRLGSRRSAAEHRLRQYCLEGDLAGARNFVAQQRVFVATVATMATRLQLLQLLGVRMDTLIADEASQLTEPQLLGLLMPFRKFILIGDQNQLPPVVAQEEQFCAVGEPALRQAGITDLRCSLFERLMQHCKTAGWPHAWGMLNTHFRMHNDIAGLINHYYAGQLTAGRATQAAAFTGNSHAAPGGWAQLLARGRALFLPSPYEATSKMHRTEAMQVVSLLRYLKQQYGAAFSRDTAGVVTPWRTQISLIRELIGNDEVLQELNIDTVERFQGAENDIIIVSLAVYHPVQLQTLQNIGRFCWEQAHIEVDRKLLVTLSRARQQVVIMGYEPVLRQSAHYRRMLKGVIALEPVGIV